MLRKNTSQCKIPIVPEEGWFGQSKYSNIEHRQKTFYVVSVSLSKRTATSLRFRCSYVWDVKFRDSVDDEDVIKIF